ncbi:GmrSD restriction endonuclease domain-containing protein [Streptomyces sp. CA-132043]|uniref:restriction system modified-DNA reader domain-containing protein n=1 Tax=Streptomyces sp. CA-132043 TaxID=3240048 RepID=UPI003D8E6DB1
MEKDPEYLPDVTVLWQPGNRKKAVREFLARLAEKRELTESEKDRLDTALDDLYDLQSYTFKVVELSDTIDEEQVAEIFVRINSQGVTLNQADFILTLLSVFWDEGRRELEEFCRASHIPSVSGPSSFNWYIQPEPAQLLRVTIVLALRRAVLKHAYAVLRGRSADTGRPSTTLREEQFAQLQSAQKHVLNLTHWHEFLQCLERAGFRGSKMISSGNAVLYTYALWLIGRVDHRVPLDRLRETIARWFFMAHTTSRYSGSFESRVEQDLARLHGVPQGDADAFIATLDKIIDSTLTSDFWAITLPNGLETAASKSPALMAYIASLNILDAEALLSTGSIRSRLDPSVTARKGIERHHLFPRNHLKNQGISETQRINQIANMALVDWSDNIAISDRSPAEYWPQQLTDKQLPDDRIARQRHWHALPDGWEQLPYDTFLQERRRLIAGVVREAFDTLSDSAYRPAYPTPSVPAPRTTTPWIRVSQLLDAGLLTPGTRLTPRNTSLQAEAVVDEAGDLIVDSRGYDSPSPAAKAVVGSNANGWTFWMAHLADGPVLLADLRERYWESTAADEN